MISYIGATKLRRNKIRCWFPDLGFQSVVSRGALGNKSGSFCEAVNCEQSEQEGKFPFATLWFQCLVSSPGSIRALGNKSGSFCEAVNCEQSEQKGKFPFATLWFSERVSNCWFQRFDYFYYFGVWYG